MSDSVTPSDRYSSSGSPVALTKGRTATDSDARGPEATGVAKYATPSASTPTAATDARIVRRVSRGTPACAVSPVVWMRRIFSPNSRSCRSALRSASISVIAG